MTSRPAVHALLHAVPLDLHSDHARALLQTLRNASTALYPDDHAQDKDLHRDDPLLDALLAEQPCAPDRLAAVLPRLLQMDCLPVRISVVRFLLRQLEPAGPCLHCALSLIRRHCCTLLHEARFRRLRDAIFAQTLSLWNADAVSDLVTYRLVMGLLGELRVPSDVWLSTLATSAPMHYRRCLADCDRILEEHVSSPSLAALRAQAFAESITPGTVASSLSIQIRIALYTALLPAEMGPLAKHLSMLHFTTPGENGQLELSHDLIQAIGSCPAHTLSMLEQEIDDILEHFFGDSQDRGTLLWPDQGVLAQMDKGHPHLESSKDLTGLLKECMPILGAAHPRFMVQITFFITSLMQAILQFHHKQGDITWDECCSLCFSAWAHAFASWLDRAVFETCAAADSFSVRALARLVVCLIVCMHSGQLDMGSRQRDPLAQEITKLWTSYKDMRTLFLGSFDHNGQDQLQEDLKLVQTLLFACLSASD